MEAAIRAREVAGEVERRLATLATEQPRLGELPVRPLEGLDDLVRLELALQRFAKIHRSGQSRALVRRVRAVLGEARTRLREPSGGACMGASGRTTSI
ncbi:MAG: hypothetical protein M5U08_07565 [Burkholderiales bacterium]|nr:hypothetical protein [Burkholderiales bacterium]